MRSNLISMMVLCCMLFGSVVYGTDFFWDGGGADNLWDTAGNWNPDGIPGSADGAIVEGNHDLLIDSTVAASASYAQIGRAGTSTLTMTGGSLAVANWELILGVWGGDNGVVNLSDGTISAPNMYVGSWGSGNLNMTGGVVNLTWSLLVAPNHVVDEPGHVQLDSGTIYADSLAMGTYGTLDITGDGMLVLSGEEDLSWYITTSTLTANGTVDDVSIVYDGTNTIVTAIPEPATMALLAIGGLFLRKRKV